MFIQKRWLLGAVLLFHQVTPGGAQDTPRRWSESEIVEQFLSQSPHAKELRARVALAEAEARTRAVYSNPSADYSLEGAGYTAFFQASQTVPLSGRVRLLREAGTATASAADANREAALWSLRSDLRSVFYRLLALQDRVQILASGSDEIAQLSRMLRQREDEGEGSRYDRLRAEREAAELRIDVTAVHAGAHAASARLSGYLPEGSQVHAVQGDLAVPGSTPLLEDLVPRAMTARADYRAEQRNLARYQLEERAASRLRIPEPQITGGVKRADGTAVPPDPIANVTRTGVAFSVSVPIPIFNNGRYEVARYRAEQEQASARMMLLARQIRTEVQGAWDVLAIRRQALITYQRELEPAGTELTRITRVAYQEGEVGILELLDSYRVGRASSLRLLELRAALKEAWIELERTVGEEVRP